MCSHQLAAGSCCMLMICWLNGSSSVLYLRNDVKYDANRYPHPNENFKQQSGVVSSVDIAPNEPKCWNVLVKSALETCNSSQILSASAPSPIRLPSLPSCTKQAFDWKCTHLKNKKCPPHLQNHKPSLHTSQFWLLIQKCSPQNPGRTCHPATAPVSWWYHEPASTPLFNVAMGANMTMFSYPRHRGHELEDGTPFLCTKTKAFHTFQGFLSTSSRGIKLRMFRWKIRQHGNTLFLYLLVFCQSCSISASSTPGISVQTSFAIRCLAWYLNGTYTPIGAESTHTHLHTQIRFN